MRKKVEARLTNGEEIYPHREDLYNIPFWKCDKCRNYVGCHHKTNRPTYPTGNIAHKELRYARKKIHELLDPIWQTGRMKRRSVYKQISNALEWDYHTAKIRSIDEARNVYRILLDLEKSLEGPVNE